MLTGSPRNLGQDTDHCKRDDRQPENRRPPIGTNPHNPLDSLERFKAQAARLSKMTAEAGRDPKAVGLSLRVTVFGETAPPQASDGKHRLFAGQPALVAADIRALRDMGVDSIDFGFGGSSADEVLAGMQKFRAEVLPLV